MNLYEIDKAILACIDPETGELIDEEALAALQMEREKKLRMWPAGSKTSMLKRKPARWKRRLLQTAPRLPSGRWKSSKNGFLMHSKGSRLAAASAPLDAPAARP